MRWRSPQKRAQEVFAEHRYPVALILVFFDELLHGCPVVAHALELLLRGILLRIDLAELPAQFLIAAPVLILLLGACAFYRIICSSMSLTDSI